MDRGLVELMIGRIPGISLPERLRLLRRLEDPSPLFRGGLEELLGRPLRKPVDMEKVRREAEGDAARSRLLGMPWVSYDAPEYPPLLRELPDPPVLLFYRGRLPNPERPLAAVVGTRRPSARAAAEAYDISLELTRGGVPVVSGLALGIDALAHRGSLEGGGPTVAVLGSGLDEIYPAVNRPLARRIVENGGVLFSEYPPGTRPRPWQFPARNRIIAGLARGTLIVEAPLHSGALITAGFALDQGRDLWVASSGAQEGSGPAFGEGSRRLVLEGAGVISSGYAILEEWGLTTTTGTGDPPFSGAALASSLAAALHLDMKD